MFPLSVRQSSILLLTVLIVLSLLTSSLPQAQASGEKVIPATGNTAPTAALLPFGYGMVMANSLDRTSAQEMGFNWIMVFDPPGLGSYPNVLRRVKATSTDLFNLPAFRSRVVAQASGVQAIQIGNEPNLNSEWITAPSAAEYRQVLCEAYTAIKQAYPTVIVVSGGLAPTGRVPGIWNGHPGHDGLKQDEREFLKEFIAAGGGNCLDAVGYNALGFRANYDAAPDVNGGTTDTDCAGGLCFRSVEKAREIMQTLGLDKPIWATEVGWLTPPPEHCLTDPRWPSRTWQIVTPEQQAQNLVGAFRYARVHWPWLQAMFVFNLDFSSAPWYDECEQMRYYSVNRQPTYDALLSMSKVWTSRYLPLLLQ
ncbi:MAG TPA: hypothetical protein VLG46_02170 [Anaerolineae bacterium]|nr:hypothetical protein [Anaerolineae bacterium]